MKDNSKYQLYHDGTYTSYEKHCIFSVYPRSFRGVSTPRKYKLQMRYFIVYHERVLHHIYSIKNPVASTINTVHDGKGGYNTVEYIYNCIPVI